MKNFNFSWKISLTALVLPALMLKASSWQWGRYLEKTKLLKTYEINYQPLKLTEVSNSSLEQNLYKKVEIEAEINFENQFLIANRRDASGPDFWLLAEYKLLNRPESLIVSRGLIPFADREKSSFKKYDTQQIKLQGVIQKSVKQGSFVSPAQISGQPDYIFMFPDIEKICSKINRPCISTDYYIQKVRKPGEPEFPKESLSIEVPPSTHYGYTFEWILLALFTSLVAFFLQAYPNFFNRIFMKIGNSNTVKLLIVLNIFFIPYCQATEDFEEVSGDALIIEHLGQKLDLDLVLNTEDGTKKISDFLSENKPLILAPVYYECPRLCNLSQTGLLEVINKLKLDLGADYNVLSISFNDKETVESTKKAASVYRNKLKKELIQNSQAWKFAVSDKETIKNIMNQIGFSFKEDKGEFIHSAGLVIITPKGVISRYFYGIQFAPDQLRLALVEAAEGRIGDSFDRILMYCFRYDSTKGQYTLAVWNITRAICSIFAIALFAFLVQLRRREKLSTIKEKVNESF